MVKFVYVLVLSYNSAAVSVSFLFFESLGVHGVHKTAHEYNIQVRGTLQAAVRL